MPARKKTPESTNFESALAELEALVERMEAGDTTLEEAMKLFERGVALTNACQASLKDAEQKVQILLDKRAEAAPEEFEEHAGD